MVSNTLYNGIMKQFSRSFTVVTLVAAMIIGSTMPTGAYAADPVESMTLTPTEKRHTVQQGGVINDSFVIFNDGQTAYDFTVYAAPYSVKGESYEADFARETKTGDAYKWVQFEKTLWHVGPRQKVTVPYTITVNSGVPSGGHYGVIFAEQQPVKAAQVEGNRIDRKKRLGLLVYVNVGGINDIKAETKSITVPFYQPSVPMTATARIASNGSTDFQTTVRFAVMDLLGNVKYQRSNDYTILPATVRAIEMDWPDSPWFGLYRVHMETVLPNGNVTKDGIVVVAPRWLLFIALLALLIGGANAIRRRQLAKR